MYNKTTDDQTHRGACSGGALKVQFNESDHKLTSGYSYRPLKRQFTTAYPVQSRATNLKWLPRHIQSVLDKAGASWYLTGHPCILEMKLVVGY